MKALAAAARSVRRHAHAPYSGFRVGAAVRSASGRIFVGCNVENAAFPEGMCAEAAAIAAMVAAGERRIDAIAIAGSGAAPCAPCGGCRQKIAEFAEPGVPVLMLGEGDAERVATIAELLPYGFGRSTMQTSHGNPVHHGGLAPLEAAAAELRPRTAVLLGSGLQAVAEAVHAPRRFDYADLPGFPRPAVPGHAGALVLGRLGGVPVCLLCGRVHLYEGASAAASLLTMTATLKTLGVERLIITSAVGSLHPDWPPGTLVLVEDHINFQGTNPLLDLAHEGPPPFLDLSGLYDAELRAELRDAAAASGLRLEEGVYLATPGPCFETPAEIRAFRALGADVVGMSLVPEAIAAHYHGLRIAALAVITNPAAGLAREPLDHARTLEVASRVAGALARLLQAALGAG